MARRDLRSSAAWLALAALLTAACGASEPAPAPDVFLISVDTLRADRIGAYGGGTLTPRLDALAARSVVFERAWAPVPFTLPSVSALLSGRHPQTTGVRSNLGILPGRFPTLATRLREAGYRSAAVVSNFTLRDTTGLDRGFEIYDDHFTASETGRPQPERVAAETRAAALAALDRIDGDAPVFLWVHFQDPHGPYTPPAGHLEAAPPPESLEGAPPDDARELPVADRGLGGIPPYQLLGDERRAGVYRAAYDAEVRYVDAEIGALLDGIAARRPLGDAVVVFVSDHGEGLGEGDYWFSHGEFLSEPLVRVPLWVSAPGLAPARRTDTASLLDVPATVLGRLGLDADAATGRDLLAPGAAERSPSLLLATFGESLVPRLALVDGGFKYVVHFEADGRREEVFRIDGLREHAHDDAQRLAELRETFRREGPRLESAREELRQSLSAFERERLEALGYVE